MAEPLAETVLHHLSVALVHADAGLRVRGFTGVPGGLASDAAEDLEGRPLVDLFPELIGCEEELEAVALGQDPGFELPMINRLEPDGSERRYLSLSALPHPERPLSLLLLVQDVTSQGRLHQQAMQHLNELRLLRAQLEAANARLVRLDADKSAFLRMAAHDLRAPLTVIRGYVEMVRDSRRLRLDRDAVESLHIVHQRTLHMARLIDDLLDVEKIESGEVKLRRQPVDLAALVEQVGRSFLPLAQKAGLVLEWHVAPDLPHPLADWDRLVQVLNNLVSNACKFTPPGGTVSIDAFQEPGQVAVEVRDTGLGISEPDQASLFQRFFRSDEARLRRLAGTGLGLSIVKAIVEQHRGSVFFRSQLGQGSTFGLCLPLEGR